ncbi:hypothetical protein Airi01_056640 [Actinoallomurus iriomotensis]|uniref:Gram-positive cocci surface proteins LPxTG domain-containing protein n=1 Tax=Actinoallomurus iriomotensis TaxID=478107 RepID=A0A9W6RNS3_9ACTN|nr:hypothetical protein Airi01_056640 [Actinoallomurus iriomotensis]
MRVKTLTLTTASAAALTIGLASPALALASTADMLGAVHNQTGFGAHHQGVLHNGMHQVALPKGDDDDDEGDDDGGGDAEIGGVHRSHHANGPRGLCGVGGRIGGMAHGCGEESGDDDDDDEGPGGGDFASEHSSACCAGGAARVKVTRPAPAPPAPRHYVPTGAVRTGFGGTQGANVPLGVAGMSLLLGGAGLLPLARRRLQASARS